MFKSYITTAFRNIKKYKGYSFINMVGLSVGITCCFLIMLWVFDELSFDRFHKNASNLYKVEQDYFYSGETYHVYPTPYPMGPAIKAEVPEIIEQTRYTGLGNVLLRYKDKVFFENRANAVDPSFLQMLTYPFLSGNPEKALSEPNSVAISEEIASKYFGTENPIGKIIALNNEYGFTVTGVFKNVPTNSFLQFDILIPFDFTEETGQYQDSWRSNSIITLVQLHDDASIPEVNTKITEIRHRHVADSFTDPQSLRQFNEDPMTQVMLIPLTDVHLRRHSDSGQQSGVMTYIYAFMVVAFFVLLIACINFMNLATARSAGRAKEVGVRKVVGAKKANLIKQFYSESILQACLALFFAIFLTASVLPQFNALVGKEFEIKSLLPLKFVIGMISITLMTGIFAGSYPALFLSAFQPVKVLKGAFSRGVKSGLFRKTMVLIQFTLSIFLIIGTGIVYRQMNYMQNMELGYDKEQVIYIPLRGDTRESYEVFKEILRGDPDILSVSGSWQWPAYIGADSGGAEWEGKDPELDIRVCFNVVDFDYVETMKIEMVEGRGFAKTFTSDSSGAFLINEELLRIMGKESAINERFNFWGIDGTIIGVMKDFNFKSLHSEIEPLAITINTNFIDYALIRLASGDIPAGIKTVQSAWQKFFSDYPFEYHFLDQALETNYQNERTTRTLVQIFAMLALLIACLGLFGLASFTAEQRTKEIGIRKVLGASVSGVIFLLTKEFTRWVLIANLGAWPVAYFLMKRWLQNFAYRMNLGMDIFVLSGVLAFGIALFTVGFQSVKVALANPVKALRYE
jgi:putative ABC transport system permease protein